MNKLLILDNIRSAYNVGSIFRTADGAGVEKIFLVGYTPLPIDRFGRTQPEIAKTSLGAASFLEWEHLENEDVTDMLEKLRADGYQIVAVEQTEKSIDINDFVVPPRVVYILGNEVDGVSGNLLALSDQAIEIPMMGEKESLNVSVAAGIVLFKS